MVLDDFVPADHVCRVIDAFIEMFVMSDIMYWASTGDCGTCSLKVRCTQVRDVALLEL